MLVTRMPRNLKSRVGPPVSRAYPRGRVLNYIPVGSEEQSTIFLKFTYFVCWSLKELANILLVLAGTIKRCLLFSGFTFILLLSTESIHFDLCEEFSSKSTDRR